jgi:hypothetical protein
MKNLMTSKFFLLIIGSIMLWSIACKKENTGEEETPYTVNIAIKSPANNAEIAVGSTFTVEVEYTRDQNIIHNILVEVLKEDGSSLTKLVDRHAHVPNSFTFKDDNVNISQAGTYKIRALSTDLVDNGNTDNNKKNRVEHTIVVK